MYLVSQIFLLPGRIRPTPIIRSSVRSAPVAAELSPNLPSTPLTPSSRRPLTTTTTVITTKKVTETHDGPWLLKKTVEESRPSRRSFTLPEEQKTEEEDSSDYEEVEQPEDNLPHPLCLARAHLPTAPTTAVAFGDIPRTRNNNK